MEDVAAHGHAPAAAQRPGRSAGQGAVAAAAQPRPRTGQRQKRDRPALSPSCGPFSPISGLWEAQSSVSSCAASWVIQEERDVRNSPCQNTSAGIVITSHCTRQASQMLYLCLFFMCFVLSALVLHVLVLSKLVLSALVLRSQNIKGCVTVV